MIASTALCLTNHPTQVRASPEPRYIGKAEHGIQQDAISRNAREVVHRLVEQGFQAELVGGCVRDLVLGRIPKDFDVVTNATPDDVRRVFPRSRIVGRRFQIVHVRFGREVIEVSTYRAGSEEGGSSGAGLRSEAGRILRDNIFGERQEDVFRRDFTLNALYYDLEKDQLIDYVDGFADLRQRVIRFIGEPAVRIEEDPVRMLRVARFRAKLSLDLSPGVEDACLENAFLLRHVPPARLFDEVLKLFQSGHAARSFDELEHLGLFAELFPEADRAYSGVDLDLKTGLVMRGIENTDQRIADGKPVIPAFLFAVFLWRAVKNNLGGLNDERLPSLMQLQKASHAVLVRQVQRVAIPRRISSVVIEIWDMALRLLARRPRNISRLLEHKRFRAGYDFLLLQANAGEVPIGVADWWTTIQEADATGKEEMIRALGASPGGRKRRRNPRKRKPRGNTP